MRLAHPSSSPSRSFPHFSQKSPLSLSARHHTVCCGFELRSFKLTQPFPKKTAFRLPLPLRTFGPSHGPHESGGPLHNPVNPLTHLRKSGSIVPRFTPVSHPTRLFFFVSGSQATNARDLPAARGSGPSRRSLRDVLGCYNLSMYLQMCDMSFLLQNMSAGSIIKFSTSQDDEAKSTFKSFQSRSALPFSRFPAALECCGDAPRTPLRF
jgi:hypothetical protein